MEVKDKIRKKYRAVKIASFIAPALCITLLLIGRLARDNGDLVRAFILSVTSVVVVIIYYIALRRFFNFMRKNKDGD